MTLQMDYFFDSRQLDMRQQQITCISFAFSLFSLFSCFFQFLYRTLPVMLSYTQLHKSPEI